MLDLYAAPLWFGFAQAWLYAILLIYRSFQNSRLSDLLLALVLIGMSFNIWEYMLGFSGINILWEELEFFPRGMGLALPALFYFYLKSQVNSKFRFQKKQYIHFLPFAIYFIYHVTVFCFGTAAVSFWKENFHNKYRIFLLESAGVFISSIYYFILSWRLYKQYAIWINTQFSDTEKVNLKWFRNFLIVIVVAFLAYWVKVLATTLFKLNFYEDWWDNLIIVFLIYYLAITGFNQFQSDKDFIFNETEEKELEILPKTKLAETDKQHYTQKIEQLIVHEKLYLSPELTLSELAQKSNINTSVLSATINQHYGKNFNDFINEFRVKEFQSLVQLPENKNITLLGLAFDCGFNSKATFNRAIKKHTGKAPKDFL